MQLVLSGSEDEVHPGGDRSEVTPPAVIESCPGSVGSSGPTDEMEMEEGQ